MSTWIKSEVSRWLKFVQLCALPPTCVLCGKAGQQELDLCRNCRAALPTIPLPCLACGLALPPNALGEHCGACLLQSQPITRTLAALAYQHPVDRLIGQFKYQRCLHAGRVVTQLLLERVRECYRPEQLPQLLIPVPLHPERLRQRGFNQAQLIARDLGKALGIPLADQLLRRTRVTPPQQGLPARERRRNLRGAFELAPAWSHARHERIALVDDVATTMSTIREIAQLLQRSHPSPPEIHLWCLARVG